MYALFVVGYRCENMYSSEANRPLSKLAVKGVLVFIRVMYFIVTSIVNGQSSNRKFFYSFFQCFSISSRLFPVVSGMSFHTISM